jgi:hypothetical protein
MLNIEKKTNGTELTVALTGRLDTTTAPELDKELKDNLRNTFTERNTTGSRPLSLWEGNRRTARSRYSVC